MKSFSFFETSGKGDGSSVVVLEKDLKHEHLDLMTGELIRHFEDMPDRVKNRFMGYMARVMMDKSDFKIVPKNL